jgi:multiple antibiotic resistance protein
MDHLLEFLHLVFVGVVALFPPVNPLGTALIVDPLLRGLEAGQRKDAAKKITLYCFIICTVSLLAGSWFLKLFGLTIPVVQVGGGIMICKMGWQLLSPGNQDRENREKATPAPYDSISEILFYPVAFPMTAGAGTIAVLLTLSAHSARSRAADYFLNIAALLLSVAIICLVIYLCYNYTPRMIRRLGSRGAQIVNRLSAFFVFCVGIQITVEGLTNLFPKK